MKSAGFLFSINSFFLGKPPGALSIKTPPKFNSKFTPESQRTPKKEAGESLLFPPFSGAFMLNIWGCSQRKKDVAPACGVALEKLRKSFFETYEAIG